MLNSLTIKLKIYNIYYSLTVQWIELKYEVHFPYNASLYPICLVIAELLLNSWNDWTQIYYFYFPSTVQWIELKMFRE